MKARRRRFDERGAVGGVEGLAFGVLIFVVGTLVVLNAWAVVDAKLAVSAAAREAGRAFVEADNVSAGRLAAEQAAVNTVDGHARGRGTAVTIAAPSGFRRCGAITATVSVVVDRVRLPLVGGAGGPITVQADHIEHVDPYRGGVGGGAAC